jgi:hypothetical protein
MHRTDIQRQASRSMWMVAVLAIVTLITGCSTSGTPASSEGEEERTPSVREFSDHPGVADDGWVGALGDVSDLECAGDGSAWGAQGLVTNPTDGEADYRIYVVFLEDSGDTRGIVQADVEGVSPGESRPWDAESVISGEDDLRCVLRVERVGDDAGDSGSTDAGADLSDEVGDDESAEED